MPIALTGHCASNLNSLEIVIVGGFSPVINDYNNIAYIYNYQTAEWHQLKGSESKMDLSCDSFFWHDQNHVLMSGGWRNGEKVRSEVISENKLHHMDRQTHEYIIRSAKMAELNKHPLLIGGVVCQKK